ncbi:hypothetical protein Pint_17094 [Pistacia integerrima]|uniref:Uncharacterized protein n=2 Tax=Pistacia integerrima TaxID=434235 RepID=A0ACC0YUG6_9ROSI|nr:hypothetical protein Pint_17094 [Pistacia integerrima]
MGGGAWPFLVGGAICLVNSVNERDLSLLTSYAEIIAIVGLQRGIPSKRESSARVDYVPALCTHRPSLLPIEWSGRRSRNKVSVGEPAEGSLSKPAEQNDPRTCHHIGGLRASCPCASTRASSGVGRTLVPAVAPSLRINEPRRELCQGNLNERARSRRPGHGARGMRGLLSLSITTLGNGYLGSRIDEERSEMRYLV